MMGGQKEGKEKEKRDRGESVHDRPLSRCLERLPHLCFFSRD